MLELIDVLRNPNRLATMARENRDNTMHSVFHIVFGNAIELSCSISPATLSTTPMAINVQPGCHEEYDSQGISIVARKEGKTISQFVKNVSKRKFDTETVEELRDFFNSLDCKVNYWEADFRITAKNVVSILNKAARLLPGVLSTNYVPSPDRSYGLMPDESIMRKPFSEHSEDRVSVWLSDDVLQPSIVQIDGLPAGWLRLVSMLAWLEQCPKGSICLIEEPETHLHPRLQRYLVKEMFSLWKRGNFQYFIVTHSPVFQQANAWQGKAAIFQAKGDVFETLTDVAQLLDALGYKNSDLSQSNGIIWVEGESDRIYIKHWLKLYCEKHLIDIPLEEFDFSFLEYGGSCLSHFGFGTVGGLIDMLKINRNLFLVMDRDNDIESGTNGELIFKKPRGAKARVYNHILSQHPNASRVWVSDGYTIESYLPERFRFAYFRTEEDGRLEPIRGTKVSIASKYVTTHNNWDTCVTNPECLEIQIKAILKAIQYWNS